MKKAILIAALFAAPVLAAAAPPDWLAPASRTEANLKLDADRKPAEMLTYFGIKKGDAVLDYEAGGGYYSEIMANAVGAKGSVTAWLATQFADDDKSKARWASITAAHPNVKTLMQPFEEFSAPANSYDFVLMHLSYHDTYWASEQYKVKAQDPNTFLKNVYAATKPGGTVAVVDHVGGKGDTRKIVDAVHRIDPAVVKADFIRAGFKFVGESPILHVAADDHTKGVFDPAVRGKTDRFAYKFMKPKK